MYFDVRNLPTYDLKIILIQFPHLCFYAITQVVCTDVCRFCEVQAGIILLMLIFLLMIN